MGTHLFAKSGYLMKQVVQGSARLVCAYRVFCLPGDTHLQTNKQFAGKCLILCLQHTQPHTYTHPHTPTYIYMYKDIYVCMYI